MWTLRPGAPGSINSSGLSYKNVWMSWQLNFKELEVWELDISEAIQTTRSLECVCRTAFICRQALRASNALFFPLPPLVQREDDRYYWASGKLQSAEIDVLNTFPLIKYFTWLSAHVKELRGFWKYAVSESVGELWASKLWNFEV